MHNKEISEAYERREYPGDPGIDRRKILKGILSKLHETVERVDPVHNRDPLRSHENKIIRSRIL
jgi:hypothetical protein